MRKPVIGVFGGGRRTVPPGHAAYTLAVALGRRVAESGALLLCGGRGGVMEAAARGAREGGGKAIGILPSADARSGRANDYIDYAIYTGLGDGRNFLTAGVPDAAIAMEGESGTLSEIGLALKLETPLVYLAAWKFLNQPGLPATPYADTPEQAIQQVFAALGIAPGDLVNAPLKQPVMTDQSRNMANLEQTVRGWS